MDDLKVCICMSNEKTQPLDYKVGEPDWDELKRMKLWQSCPMVRLEKDDKVN